MVLNKYAFSLTNSTAGTQGNLRKMTFNKNIMDIGENVTIPSTSLMTYDEIIVSNIIARNNLLLGPNTNFSADTTYLYLNTGRSLIYENSNSTPSSTFNNVYFYSPYKRDSIDIFFGSNSVFSSNTSLSILKSSNYALQVQKNPVHLVGFTFTDTEIYVSSQTGETVMVLRENESEYELYIARPDNTNLVLIPANAYYKYSNEMKQENPIPFLVIKNIVIYGWSFDNVHISKEHFYLSSPYNDVIDRLPTLEDDYIVSTANHYNMQLYSPSEEEDFMGFFYQYNIMGITNSRWSESVLPRPTLGIPGFWEGDSPSLYLPSGIALPNQFYYFRTFVKETTLIHMEDFIQATQTINEPEEPYMYLSEDNENYIISIGSKTQTIEEGTFYKYLSLYPTFNVNYKSFRLDGISIGTATFTFPKSKFDIGPQAATIRTSIDLTDPFIQNIIQRNNLTYGSTINKAGITQTPTSPIKTYIGGNRNTNGYPFNNNTVNLYFNNAIASFTSNSITPVLLGQYNVVPNSN